MHTYVQSSTIQNTQKMEAAQISINRRLDKQIVVYSSNVISFSYKKESSTDTHYNVEEP